MNNKWSDHMIQTLRQMAADGYCTREIGEALGVTRNAIIGKAKRLKVKLARNKGGRQKGQQAFWRRKPQVHEWAGPPVKVHRDTSVLPFKNEHASIVEYLASIDRRSQARG